MRYCIFILTVFYQFNLQAQIDIKKSQFGLCFSTDKSKVYHKNGTFSFSTGVIFSRKSEHKPRRVTFGLQYAHLTYKTQQFEPTIEDTFKVGYYDVSFIDIPIKWNRYLYQGNSLSAYLSYGMSVSSCFKHHYQRFYYLTATGEEIYHDPRENIPISYELFLGLNFGFGFEYQFKNDFSVSLEPEFRWRTTIDLIDGDNYSTFGTIFGIRKSF